MAFFAPSIPSMKTKHRRAQPASLKVRGVQLLSQREHSVHELRQKLLRHARLVNAAAQQAAEGEMDPPRHDGDAGASGAHPESFVPLRHQNTGRLTPASLPPDATEDAVEEVLAWLQSQGYLSDTRFLQSRVQVRSERFGNLRIRQELAQHQVELTPEAALALRASELGRAQAVSYRKFGGSQPATPAEAAKRARFLAQRGFSSDVVRQVLRGAGGSSTDD